MKALNIVLGILTIILGIFCIFRPGITFLGVAWMLGFLLLLGGINILVVHFRLKRKEVFEVVVAVILILSGLLLLFNNFSALFTDKLILYFVGVGIIVNGILQICRAFTIKGDKGSSWGWVLVAGILLILGGIVLLCHPLITAMSLGYFIGFSILFEGVTMISQASGTE